MIMSLKKRAHVLIITPSYNRADLLPDAIESVLAQDYPYKKIVIIDDGSTDNTKEVCRKYIDAYPETVFYYYKENGGCASARNFGLNLIDDTIGYICFLDSDDKMLPGKLSREIDVLQKTSEVGFTYSDTVYYIEDKAVEIREKPAAYNKPERFVVELFLSNNVSMGAILCKSEILVGGRFDESMQFNEDSEFLQRIAIENNCIYVPNPGSWVRIHKGSKSQNRIEIYRNVLYASLKALRTYPSFYQTAPALFENRINQIKKQLFTELMLGKQWEEAEKYTSCAKERLFVKMKCSLYYHFATLMKGKMSGALLRCRILWKKIVP